MNQQRLFAAIGEVARCVGDAAAILPTFQYPSSVEQAWVMITATLQEADDTLNSYREQDFTDNPEAQALGDSAAAIFQAATLLTRQMLLDAVNELHNSQPGVL